MAPSATLWATLIFAGTYLVLATGRVDGVPLLEGREPVDGHAAAYVCESFACRTPITEPAALTK